MTTTTEALPAAPEAALPRRRGRGPGLPRRPRGRRPSNAPRNLLDRQRRKLFIPLVSPALLFYVVLFIGPALAAAWISLHKWSGAGPMEWVGVDNYRHILSSELFLNSFKNTLLLLFVVGTIIFVTAFALTLVLRNMKGKSLVRSVIFFPHLVNALVFGVLAGFLLNPNGLVNAILDFFGIHNHPAWLASENIFPLIMATMVLISTGYYTTIIMAGVDRIPDYLFEDCALAGVNGWQRLRYLILPLTWDVFATCAVLWTISSIKIFEVVWLFGGSVAAEGAPPIDTWTVAVYTYVTAFSGNSIPNFGRATASAVVSLILISVLVVLLRRVTRREAIEF
ncbi:sugar ABC transporter permease [Tessaracoccus sp. OS52]|uniref:carbohydrate ABC transporter permease n=1 Tax=Tessaracoccus sp. OS52 TaxID=2886691 RepID=UPI001D110302|nr:sugar ABC transporter permease [Tessaracoccus sp. OS52]MCC2594295.1 sugar ABC transporter permease [Tessaracoccus sp. OS52]